MCFIKPPHVCMFTNKILKKKKKKVLSFHLLVGVTPLFNFFFFKLLEILLSKRLMIFSYTQVKCHSWFNMVTIIKLTYYIVMGNCNNKTIVAHPNTQTVLSDIINSHLLGDDF